LTLFGVGRAAVHFHTFLVYSPFDTLDISAGRLVDFFFFFTKMGWTFCSFQVLGMWLPIWLFLVRHEAIFCMYGLIADDFMLGIMMDISERTVSEVHSLSWWLSKRREVKEPYCMRNVSSVLLPSKVSAKLPRLPRHPIQNANTS
jgi:hypothetical protein